jgi:signal recognition particle receptor subunit beta
MDANVESVRNLDKNLKEQGYDIARIPYVLQFNKRDLPTALSVDEMYRRLNVKGEPTFEATASTGAGVFETLKASARQILTELRKK